MRATHHGCIRYRSHRNISQMQNIWEQSLSVCQTSIHRVYRLVAPWPLARLCTKPLVRCVLIRGANKQTWCTRPNISCLAVYSRRHTAGTMHGCPKSTAKPAPFVRLAIKYSRNYVRLCMLYLEQGQEYAMLPDLCTYYRLRNESIKHLYKHT